MLRKIWGLGFQYSKMLIHKTVGIYVTLINQSTNSHRTLQELQRGKKEGETSGKLNPSQLKSIVRLTAISVDFGSYPKWQKKKRCSRNRENK